MFRRSEDQAAECAGRSTFHAALVDSAESCAQFLSERLDGRKLLARTRRRAGVIRPFVTDEAERFDAMAKRFLGVPADPARKVDLPALTPA